MTAWEFLIDLNEVCSFQTREGKKVGRASNSELKRWLQNKAVIINGNATSWNDELSFPLTSVVLFPKKPITLW
jgi:hypothetical protein